MNSHPFSKSEEAAWHERVRRRELHRCLVTLSQLAEDLQFTEDFPSPTPKILAKLISVTAKLLAQAMGTSAPANDLGQINTLLGIITTHLRYVERARVPQTPWSMIQTAERLLKLAAGAKSHFIVRPSWSYNYSIVGEFASVYREFLACWAWFPLDDWKKELGPSYDDSIYCISFPRIERANCLLHANWGHEVGHILTERWANTDFVAAWAGDESKIRKPIEDHVNKNPPPVDPLFKAMAIQEIVAKQMRATMEAAKYGFVELLCDMLGVHILGLSALAANMEFSARFSLDVSPLQGSTYYPPWRYRLRKMLRYCAPDLNSNEGMGYPNQEISAFIEWLRDGERLAAGDDDTLVIQSNVVTREAYGFISAHWDEAAQKVTAMLPVTLSKPYRLHEHHGLIAKLIERLRQGVPPNETRHLSGQPASFQDILIAAWAYKVDEMKKSPSWGSPEEYDLLFRLVLKGCESSFVHSEWGNKIVAQEQKS